MNLNATSEPFVLDAIDGKKSPATYDATLSASVNDSDPAELAIRFDLILGNGNRLEFDWSAEHAIAFCTMVNAMAEYAIGINLKRFDEL